jgi:hypothetical protein
MLSRIFLLLLSFLTLQQMVIAQAPSVINYQGAARLSNGNIMANQAVSVRLSIRHASPTGTIQYGETRAVSTDAHGIFNIQLGGAGAASVIGSMNAVTWDNGLKFLQVELDASGGSNFLDMGTQQLVSVPYALHATQASTLSSSATILPEQITSGGAAVNEVLQFDGTHWVPATLFGQVPLPFLGSDANLVSFGLTNTSALGGTAIYGKSNNSSTNATGVRGEASGTNGNGVLGKATGTGAYGVLGQNTNGIGIKGSTTNVNFPAILGENTSGVGVKGITQTNLSTSTAVQGINNGTNGSGVSGEANFVNGIGVLGTSSSGSGVKGVSTSQIGVHGESTYGISLYGYSSNGFALEANGNVKISGGFTNPTHGAVLTSDASGVATWKNNRIGFGVLGCADAYTSLAHAQTRKMEFKTEQYDFQGNFIPTSGTSNSNTSVFTVPVSGLYNFNSQCVIRVPSSSVGQDRTTLFLKRLRAGTTTDIAVSNAYINDFSISSDFSQVNLNTELPLLTGDKVWIELQHMNDGSANADLENYFTGVDVWFRGHLVFAD